MDKSVFRLLKKLKIVDYCPNCESAQITVPEPHTLTHCVVCGDKDGKITGWVWAGLFSWITQRNVKRNLKLKYPEINW